MKRLCALVGIISLGFISYLSADDMSACLQRHADGVCSQALNR
jgi:hypothetical protein